MLLTEQFVNNQLQYVTRKFLKLLLLVCIQKLNKLIKRKSFRCEMNVLFNFNCVVLRHVLKKI